MNAKAMNTRVPITNAFIKHWRVTVKMTVGTTVMKEPIVLVRKVEFDCDFDTNMIIVIFIYS